MRILFFGMFSMTMRSYQHEQEIKAILESRKNKRSLLNPKIHSLSRDKRTEKPGG